MFLRDQQGEGKIHVCEMSQYAESYAYRMFALPSSFSTCKLVFYHCYQILNIRVIHIIPLLYFDVWISSDLPASLQLLIICVFFLYQSCQSFVNFIALLKNQKCFSFFFHQFHLLLLFITSFLPLALTLFYSHFQVLEVETQMFI